ncbi:MAG TPA: lysophospholipid acyltransferase family protein [Fimbriimonadaceae bacterium]|nr:lysophospholipid acyltransferase family protein [Fimbriimonadaceae bacterium]
MSGERSAWYAFILRLVRNGFFRLITGGIRSYGEENIPKTGGVIFAPNHVSNLDPPAVACGTNKRQLAFMAKEELFKGLFGKIIASLGAFPVRRGDSDTEAIRKALALLEQGRAVLVFPEGTRGDGRTMGPINRGVAMLAKRSGAQVLPVGVIGTHVIAPKGGKGLKRRRVVLAYGKPFTYEQTSTGQSEKENRELFAKELEKRIIALCAEHGLALKTAESDSPPASHPGPEPAAAPRTSS